jgi:hypothetical protein
MDQAGPRSAPNRILTSGPVRQCGWCAKAALNSTRLKGLTEQQRIDRVEFVAGNTLVPVSQVSHEMGHDLISEMNLPVLGWSSFAGPRKALGEDLIESFLIQWVDRLIRRPIDACELVLV